MTAKTDNRDKVYRTLRNRDQTLRQLVEATIISEPTVRRIVAELQAEELIHVESFKFSGGNRHVAVYTFGPGEDAVAPTPLTPSERRARKRLYKAKYQKRVAIAADQKRLARIRAELERPIFRHWQDAALFGNVPIIAGTILPRRTIQLITAVLEEFEEAA
jgi:hypothetical protein